MDARRCSSIDANVHNSSASLRPLQVKVKYSPRTMLRLSKRVKSRDPRPLLQWGTGSRNRASHLRNCQTQATIPECFGTNENHNHSDYHQKTLSPDHVSCSTLNSEFYDARQSPSQMDGSDAEHSIQLQDTCNHCGEFSMPTDDRSSLQENSTILQTNNSEDAKEKILELLREIVRKCTNCDPRKRPTAKEIMTLLNNLVGT